jgi:hypothetical protein
MTGSFFTYVYAPVVVWMTALSLVLIGHLAYLQVKEFKRNRRLEAKRERLGLRHA